jgi:trigger factor
MKTDLVDVNETRKNLRVEISSEVVDAQIARVASNYSRRAKSPGFRPGKAPARVVKQRFKEQILHDVVHDLVPRAVDDALREQGLEAIDTPDIRDVNVEEGQALTFTASFDTVPSFDPGEYATIALRRPPTTVDDAAVDQALQRLRDRAGRFEPIEGRGAVDGDTVTLDIDRWSYADGGKAGEGEAPRNAPEPDAAGTTKDSHAGVDVELGSKANPPGFDEQLLGLEVGAVKSFPVRYPADHPIGELAGTQVSYTVSVKGVKRRVVPELDDEFAKDMGEFDSLQALRTRVRDDLEHEARHASERQLRGELMKQLAARVPFEVPASLIEREVDRRLEEFARRLVEQNVDPRQAGIDWQAFRDSQRDAAREAVASAMALDEIAKREQLDVTEAEAEQEIGRYAERTGRTPAAVRAALEKEGGLARVYAGVRREKSIDYVMARATIAGA